MTKAAFCGAVVRALQSSKLRGEASRDIEGLGRSKEFYVSLSMVTLTS